MAGANAELLPTSAVLTCASKHINTACAEQTRAFTDCKTAGKDPRECIAQGKALTGCALATLKQLNASEKCSAEFNAYAACMDYNSNEFKMCRRQQKAFEDKCQSL